MRKSMYTEHISILFYTPYFYNQWRCGVSQNDNFNLSSNAQKINREVCS